MIRWRTGTVTGVASTWAGVQELDVELSGDLVTDLADGTVDAAGRSVRALAYDDLVGTAQVGDRVLLNIGALAMGLGTGGHALVVAVPDRLPPDPPPAPGHLVKARYTPLQTTVLGADEQESPDHRALRAADDLGAMPVVLADLHSALPAIVAGARAERPDVRVVYVMTDGGALPLAYSRTVARLAATGQLAASVTVGQAYGGTAEAVTLHSGLLAARHVLHADLAVVVQGPGNLGTGTRWGFSGVAAGEAVNAAAVLGGRPVACLRVSEADTRERHRGVSHHSRTAYGRVALLPADVVVPILDGSFGVLVRRQAAELGRLHRLVEVEVDGLRAALVGSPVRLSTMGRGLDDDEAAFLTAAAAGRHAARLLPPPADP
ncbi:MAG: DUF3866 family protein [Nocardioidaceae bacterium]